MRAKSPLLFSLSLLCGGFLAAWPGQCAPAKHLVPHVGSDVATAWQVNHLDGDDYIAPESGFEPVT
jgi:hypothetical protein